MPIYLRLDGVRGEVMKPLHEHWLEISSYQMDPSKSSKKDGFHDLYLTCDFDSTAPVLSRMSANGTRIPKGELHVIDQKSGDLLLVFTFTDIVVTTQLSTPAQGGGGPVTQSIHLNFGKGKGERGNPAAQPSGQVDDLPFNLASQAEFLALHKN